MQYLFALTLLVAPLYAVRFDLLGFTTNVCMLWVFFVLLVGAGWVVTTKRTSQFVQWLGQELRTPQGILAGMFLLSGVISLFVGGLSQDKLGQFLVLFLQPVALFILMRFWVFIKNWKLEIGNSLASAALFFVALCGLYAIIQYTTLLGVPSAWWGNSVEPKRALALFLHPNFYALFVTPLLAFLVPVISGQWTVDREDLKSVFGFNLFTRYYALYTTAGWLLGVVGLLLSLSRGGWLGLAAAVGVFLLVAANRKLLKAALVIVMVMMVVVSAVPNFRYRVLLPFHGEKSSVARFSLWHTGWEMVQDSPLLGKGLLGFSNNWDRYNTDPNLQRYPAPHNIFLNFWIDTGLLGMVSFLGLLVLALWRGIKAKKGYQLGLALACIAMLIHGLVDIPYFKNDLALVFWLLLAVL
ncbi:MAG: O-antigen ligase family protein [Candidatus Doudnabacteria bacterium]|nr:O-antigen ligase family protein [Candidatus Doudnabacteria bacterium]